MHRYLILPFLWLVSSALSAKVTGIFTSIENIVPSSDRFPETPSWQATVAWGIDPAKVAPGDTFALTLPNVFKFTSTTDKISLSAGQTSFATCTLTSGEQLSSYSQISCVALSTVASFALASGTITFPFTFNAGLTASKIDLAASTAWTAGKNKVVFKDGKDITYTVTMDGGILFPIVDGDLVYGTYYKRILPSELKFQLYYQGPSCTCVSSGTITMKYPEDIRFDCSQAGAYFAKNFNSWQVPTEALTTAGNGVITYKCTTTSITATFSNMPAGYRPYIAGVGNMIADQVVVTYSDSGVCYRDPVSRTVKWGSYNNLDPEGDGKCKDTEVTTITRDDISIRTLTTATGISTDTINVLVPRSVTTFTTTWTNSYTSTSTTTDSSGIRIVEVDVPQLTSLVTSTWTGSYTASTVFTTGGTVVVDVAVPIPTRTTTITTGSVETTTTHTTTPGATAVVEIHVPLLTSTTVGSVSGTTTTTESDTTYVVVTDILSTSTTVGSVSGTTTTTESDTTYVVVTDILSTSTTVGSVSGTTTTTESDTTYVVVTDILSTSTTVGSVSGTTTTTESDTTYVVVTDILSTSTTVGSVSGTTTTTESDTTYVVVTDILSTSTTVGSVSGTTTTTESDTTYVVVTDILSTSTTVGSVSGTTTTTESDTTYVVVTNVVSASSTTSTLLTTICSLNWNASYVPSTTESKITICPECPIPGQPEEKTTTRVATTTTVKCTECTRIEVSTTTPEQSGEQTTKRHVPSKSSSGESGRRTANSDTIVTATGETKGLGITDAMSHSARTKDSSRDENIPAVPTDTVFITHTGVIFETVYTSGEHASNNVVESESTGKTLDLPGPQSSSSHYISESMVIFEGVAPRISRISFVSGLLLGLLML